MPTSARQQLELALRILSKWRWYAILPAAIIVAGGMLYVLITPTRYSAAATLSVDVRGAANPLLRDLNLDQRREQRVAVVTETIRSWDLLQQTVLDVGPDTLAADSPQLLPYLRGKLDDRLLREREATVGQAVRQLDAGLAIREWSRDLIVISYTGLDREVAARITNTVVQRFVEHASLARQRGALATVDFIAQQLEIYQRRLEESEALVRAFREEHLEALPQQFDRQLAMLGDARAQYMASEIQLREIDRRVTLLKEQIDRTEHTVVSARTTGANPMVQEIEGRILQARVELAALRTNYTDKHPRVLELQAHIINLEEAIATEADTAVTSETSTVNPAYESLVQAHQEAQIETETLQLRREVLTERIQRLEAAVNSIPQQEQQLVHLTRDSRVNESVYNLLLRKLEEAKISQHLSERDTGLEEYTIIEPARASNTRSGPNRMRMALMVLAVAGMAGAAGVLGRQYMDESFDDGDQLAQAFDLPCLGVIPRIEKAA